MSDGPWKSLGMRPRWRRAARLAEMDASSPDEIGHELQQALAGDFRREISSGLLTALRQVFEDDRQASLFNREPDRFAAIRSLTDGSPLGALLVEIAAMVANDGGCGSEALHETMRRTVIERALRGIREIEEHHHRLANDGRSSTLRGRLETAVNHIAANTLVDQLLGTPSSSGRQSGQNHSGIDDGPRLQ
jgi:hypothetical protein